MDIKKAINNGVIPGPRMQVAGRSMNVTGAYPLLGYSWELKMPKGVQEVDGPEDGRKAVREQISHGVDWIKVYSDRSYYVRPDGVLDDVPTFTLEELKAIVDEAHRERRKVASHASALNGVHNSVEAGVDTIEHGQYIADADLKTMVAHGTYYVPTLFVGEYVAEGRAAAGAKVWLDMVRIHEDTFSRALKAGVKIAFGTDAGGFDWKINPAKEFPSDGEGRHDSGAGAALRQHDRCRVAGDAGQDWLARSRQVSPTSWPCPAIRWPTSTQLEKVNFVMKGGVVYVRP